MEISGKDLAKQLGVSTATISLVLNGKPGISDKTRRKVLEKIRTMGYEDMIKEIPTEEKQAVKTSRSKNIGFVIYKESGELLGMNSFFPLILDGIEKTAAFWGYNLLFLNIDRENIQDQIQRIRDAACEGCVIFATEMQRDALEYFGGINIPLVLFDNYFPEKSLNSVMPNNEQGTYLAVQYLCSQGHRRIGYLSSGLNINSFKEREMYAKNAVRSFGCEEPERYSLVLGYPVEVAEERMLHILQGKKPPELPTAFLADNDLVAIGAMQALKKSGYRIPEDISIVGYDDRPICELVEPALTTIRLPRMSFGAEAVECLVRMIQGGREFYGKIEINGEFVERNSAGPCG